MSETEEIRVEYIRNRFVDDDPRISVKDLVGYILKHKIILIIAALIGAAAFGVMFGKKVDHMEDDKIKQALSQITIIQAKEDIKGITLSADQIAEYESIKSSLSEAAAESAEYSAYLDNSEYMKIVPTDVKAYTKLVTLRSSDPNAGAVSGEIGNAYAAHFTQETGYLSDVAAKYNTKESYIKELLSVTFDGQVYSATDTAGAAYTTFAVKIYAFSGSAEMSKDIAEAAYGELEAYKKEIDSRYAKHRIEAVDDAEAVINDTGLESDQQGRRNTNIGMMNSVNDLQAKLDNFTMEVVKADAEYNMRNPDTSFNKKSAIKGGILGAAAGFLIPAMLLIIIYIMGDRFASETSFCNRYRMDVIASGKDQIEKGVAAAKFAIVCPDAKSAVIVGQTSEDNRKALKKSLEGAGVSCEIFDTLKDNTAAIEALAGADAVIFAEEIGVSRHTVFRDSLDTVASGSEKYAGAVLF